jgi:hypothetical protein
MGEKRREWIGSGNAKNVGKASFQTEGWQEMSGERGGTIKEMKNLGQSEPKADFRHISQASGHIPFHNWQSVMVRKSDHPKYLTGTTFRLQGCEIWVHPPEHCFRICFEQLIRKKGRQVLCEIPHIRVFGISI